MLPISDTVRVLVCVCFAVLPITYTVVVGRSGSAFTILAVCRTVVSTLSECRRKIVAGRADRLSARLASGLLTTFRIRNALRVRADRVLP